MLPRCIELLKGTHVQIESVPEGLEDDRVAYGDLSCARLARLERSAESGSHRLSKASRCAYWRRSDRRGRLGSCLGQTPRRVLGRQVEELALPALVLVPGRVIPGEVRHAFARRKDRRATYGRPIVAELAGLGVMKAHLDLGAIRDRVVGRTNDDRRRHGLQWQHWREQGCRLARIIGLHRGRGEVAARGDAHEREHHLIERLHVLSVDDLLRVHFEEHALASQGLVADQERIVGALGRAHRSALRVVAVLEDRAQRTEDVVRNVRRCCMVPMETSRLLVMGALVVAHLDCIGARAEEERLLLVRPLQHVLRHAREGVLSRLELRDDVVISASRNDRDALVASGDRLLEEVDVLVRPNGAGIEAQLLRAMLDARLVCMHDVEECEEGLLARAVRQHLVRVVGDAIECQPLIRLLTSDDLA